MEMGNVSTSSSRLPNCTSVSAEGGRADVYGCVCIRG